MNTTNKSLTLLLKRRGIQWRPVIDLTKEEEPNPKRQKLDIGTQTTPSYAVEIGTKTHPSLVTVDIGTQTTQWDHRATTQRNAPVCVVAPQCRAVNPVIEESDSDEEFINPDDFADYGIEEDTESDVEFNTDLISVTDSEYY